MIEEEALRALVRWTTLAIELLGVLVIVGGLAFALIRAALPPRDAGGDRIARLRSDLGRAILLGLEFLVAADIINTVAIEPTLDNVLVLGAIVAIRTFLSFSLEVEIEGRWPWQAGATPREREPEPPPAAASRSASE